MWLFNRKGGGGDGEGRGGDVGVFQLAFNAGPISTGTIWM